MEVLNIKSKNKHNTMSSSDEYVYLTINVNFHFWPTGSGPSLGLGPVIEGE